MEYGLCMTLTPGASKLIVIYISEPILKTEKPMFKPNPPPQFRRKHRT